MASRSSNELFSTTRKNHIFPTRGIDALTPIDPFRTQPVITAGMSRSMLPVITKPASKRSKKEKTSKRPATPSTSIHVIPPPLIEEKKEKPKDVVIKMPKRFSPVMKSEPHAPIDSIELAFVLLPTTLATRVWHRWNYDNIPSDVYIIFNYCDGTSNMVQYDLLCPVVFDVGSIVERWPFFRQYKTRFDDLFGIASEKQHPHTEWIENREYLRSLMCRCRLREYNPEAVHIKAKHHFITNVLNDFYALVKQNGHLKLFPDDRVGTLVEFYSYTKAILNSH